MAYNGASASVWTWRAYRGGALAACRGGRRLGIPAAVEADRRRKAGGGEGRRRREIELLDAMRVGVTSVSELAFVQDHLALVNDALVMFANRTRRDPFCLICNLKKSAVRDALHLAAHVLEGATRTHLSSLHKRQQLHPSLLAAKTPVPPRSTPTPPQRLAQPTRGRLSQHGTHRSSRNAPPAPSPTYASSICVGCQTTESRCLTATRTEVATTTSVRKSPTVVAPNNTTPTKITRRPSRTPSTAEDSRANIMDGDANLVRMCACRGAAGYRAFTLEKVLVAEAEESDLDGGAGGEVGPVVHLPPMRNSTTEDRMGCWRQRRRTPCAAMTQLAHGLSEAKRAMRR